MNEMNERIGTRDLRGDLRDSTVLLTFNWVKTKVQKGRKCREFDACNMRRSVRIVRTRVSRITEGHRMCTYRLRSFLAAKVALVPGIAIACVHNQRFVLLNEQITFEGSAEGTSRSFW